jgi:alkaline phosphatase
METTQFIATFTGFGLIGLAGIALTEKVLPVVPSYVMLMLLGMTATDLASLVGMIAATSAGSLTGSLCWYGVGRCLGGQRVEATVAKFGRYIFLPTRRYQQLANAYRRRHFRVTLIGQLVPVARIYLALPAGVLKLRFRAFTLAAVLGIILWNTPFLTLGYVLHRSGRDPIEVGFWVSAILIAVEALILLSLRARRKNAQAAEARPWQRSRDGAYLMRVDDPWAAENRRDDVCELRPVWWTPR